MAGKDVRFIVAEPCQASWEEMARTRSGGVEDERVRFCRRCRSNVYNLSALSRAEAIDLVGAREGSVCVRLYARPDGTVVTRRCFDRAAVAARRLAYAIFAGICLLIGAVLGSWSGQLRGRPRTTISPRPVPAWPRPAPAPGRGGAGLGKRVLIVDGDPYEGLKL
jgi:hypothetical protein